MSELQRIIELLKAAVERGELVIVDGRQYKFKAYHSHEAYASIAVAPANPDFTAAWLYKHLQQLLPFQADTQSKEPIYGNPGSLVYFEAVGLDQHSQHIMVSDLPLGDFFEPIRDSVMQAHSYTRDIRRRIVLVVYNNAEKAEEEAATSTEESRQRHEEFEPIPV